MTSSNSNNSIVRSAPSPLIFLALALVAQTQTVTEAFQPVAINFLTQQQQQPALKPSTTTTELFLAAKKKKRAKGFGDAPPPPPKQQKPAAEQPFKAPMATTPEPSQKAAADVLTLQQSSVVTQDRPGTTRESEMNQGQQALAKMRREQAEKKDAELRRVKEIRDTDKMLQESPAAAAIPEKVAVRMGKRMLPFVGIPFFGSIGAFVAFWYFATYKDITFEPGMVAASTVAILVSGLLVRKCVMF